MFTGIIKTVGSVVLLEKKQTEDGKLHVNKLGVFINSEFVDINKVNIGDSIAINGCCLTLVEKDIKRNIYYFDISPETSERTSICLWNDTMRVNCEIALKVGDHLGGHLVSGHVDEVGKLIDLQKSGDGWNLTFQINPRNADLLVQKGSITVDGISLTVNNPRFNRFSVAIIPHTWQNTTLKDLDLTFNSLVNIEYDQTAKYISKYVKNYLKYSNENKKS